MSASLPSWARVGVRVICVDANWSTMPPTRPLEPNAIYTIEDVFFADRGLGDELWCYLTEAVNPFAPDWGFQLDRFRPLTSAKSEAHDVALFRKLLRQPELVE